MFSAVCQTAQYLFSGVRTEVKNALFFPTQTVIQNFQGDFLRFPEMSQNVSRYLIFLLTISRPSKKNCNVRN